VGKTNFINFGHPTKVLEQSLVEPLWKKSFRCLCSPPLQKWFTTSLEVETPVRKLLI